MGICKRFIVDKYRVNSYFRDDALLMEETVMVPQRQFVKNRRSEIFTVYRPKKYQAHYEKGQVRPEMKVLPYGWQD